MRVSFSKGTDEDFANHRDYLRRTGKTDGHKYQKYELDSISRTLKRDIKDGLKNKKTHVDSIYPKEFEYNSENYKMYVDKKHHHVVFYKIIEPTKGKSYIQIEKCIHSTELAKQLDRKGIEPLKDADKSLLDDLETVYHEDAVNQRNDHEEEQGREEDVYDKETGKNVKRVVFTGPQGGRYYKTDKGTKVYIDESRKYKSLTVTLFESIKTSLSEYIKRRSA